MFAFFEIFVHFSIKRVLCFYTYFFELKKHQFLNIRLGIHSSMAVWAGVILLLIAAYPFATCIDAWISGIKETELYYMLFSLGGEGKELFSIGGYDVTYRLASFELDRTLLLTLTLIVIFIAVGLMVSEKKMLRVMR
jgi:hypothetical protein